MIKLADDNIREGRIWRAYSSIKARKCAIARFRTLGYSVLFLHGYLDTKGPALEGLIVKSSNPRNNSLF